MDHDLQPSFSILVIAVFVVVVVMPVMTVIEGIRVGTGWIHEALS